MLDRRPLLEPEIEHLFWSFVVNHPDPARTCWLWTGEFDSWGVAVFYDEVVELHLKASNYAYEHSIGRLPSRHWLDRMCLTPNCVYPRHYEPVHWDELADVRYERATAVSEGRLPKVPTIFPG